MHMHQLNAYAHAYTHARAHTHAHAHACAYARAHAHPILAALGRLVGQAGRWLQGTAQRIRWAVPCCFATTHHEPLELDFKRPLESRLRCEVKDPQAVV